jgi:RNA polymerase sigma-70 factor, ECF subfamily
MVKERVCIYTAAVPAPRVPPTMSDDELPDVPSDERWTPLVSAMTRAVRRQCPSWLRAEADDIAQRALAKIVAAEKVGEGKPPLAPFYLYKLAHSALVDEIRRRRRRQEVALDDVSDVAPEERAAPRLVRTPESHAAFRELGSAVRDCLIAMKRERRLSVALYLQEHTVPEAARILGWGLKRTENLVYRGLADLRACLEAKGHKP